MRGCVQTSDRSCRSMTFIPTSSFCSHRIFCFFTPNFLSPYSPYLPLYLSHAFPPLLSRARRLSPPPLMALMSSCSLGGGRAFESSKRTVGSPPATLAAAKSGAVAEADLTLLEGEWVSGSWSEGPPAVGGRAATSSYLDVEWRGDSAAYGNKPFSHAHSDSQAGSCIQSLCITRTVSCCLFHSPLFESLHSAGKLIELRDRLDAFTSGGQVCWSPCFSYFLLS